MNYTYTVGTRVLAVFAADRKPYPAQVVSVERDRITVTFLGYGNTATLPAAEVSDLPALPSGWTEGVDPSSGHLFYTRVADGSSQWERPSFKRAANVAVAARRFGAAFKQMSDGGVADSAPRASAARRRIEAARSGGGSIVRAGAGASASATATAQPDYQGAVDARRNRAAEDKMAAARASGAFNGAPAPERQRNLGPVSGPDGARQRVGGGSTNRPQRQQAQLAAADEEKKQLRQLAAALDERATRSMPRAAPIRLANGNDASMVGGFASRKPRRKPRPLATPDGMTYEELMAQMSMGGCGCGVSGC